MQLGMIGLGRMGASMMRRVLRGGHARVVHDCNYPEGLNIARSANVGQHDRLAQRGHDTETTPLRDPELYRFEMNLPEIAEVWRRGSVIGSWLLDLTATALLKDPELAGYGGRVSDSGEGRWTIQAAIDEGVPAPVLSAALFERFASRGNADFSNRVLSAVLRIRCPCGEAGVMAQGRSHRRSATPSEPQGTANELENCGEHGIHRTLAPGNDRRQ